MTTEALSAASGATSHRSAVVRLASRAARAWAERRRRRRTVDALMGLDDYLLKDIGLTRAEIRTVARRPR
jgi:uncharacterized protein YjiS (DUF1127 family)